MLVVSGGIDDIVAQLKQESAAQGLPCLFALSRRQLGYLTFKKVGVSCIGICSYEGSEVRIAMYRHRQLVTVFNWCRWCPMWVFAAGRLSCDWFGRCQIGWTSEVWFLGSERITALSTVHPLPYQLFIWNFLHNMWSVWFTSIQNHQYNVCSFVSLSAVYLSDLTETCWSLDPQLQWFILKNC